MTAFGDVDKAVAAMRGGALRLLLKPFEPKALLDQIARFTPRRHRAEASSSAIRAPAKCCCWRHAWHAPMPPCC